jgi:hypothetical protein
VQIPRLASLAGGDSGVIPSEVEGSALTAPEDDAEDDADTPIDGVPATTG